MSFFGYLSSHPLYLSVTLVSVAVVIVFSLVKYPASKLLDKVIAKCECSEKSSENTESAQPVSENDEKSPSDGADL